MSGKSKKGAGKAAPRAYGRLTRHERDTVQRMLKRGASCRQIARELGRSPSTVSSEVASHRFVTAPRERRGERVDATADLSAACPRLAAWPRCCNGCGRYRAIGCRRRPHVFYDARAAQLCADSVLVSSRCGIDAGEPAAAEALATQVVHRVPRCADTMPNAAQTVARSRLPIIDELGYLDVGSAGSDRVCHHCHQVKITGGSYRLKDLPRDGPVKA